MAKSELDQYIGSRDIHDENARSAAERDRRDLLSRIEKLYEDAQRNEKERRAKKVQDLKDDKKRLMERHNRYKAAGVILTIAAFAASGVAVEGLVRGYKAEGALDAECSPKGSDCPDDYYNNIMYYENIKSIRIDGNKGNRRVLLGFSVAGACLLLGFTMFGLMGAVASKAKENDKEIKKKLNVRPVLGPASAGLTLSGQF